MPDDKRPVYPDRIDHRQPARTATLASAKIALQSAYPVEIELSPGMRVALDKLAGHNR